MQQIYFKIYFKRGLILEVNIMIFIKITYEYMLEVGYFAYLVYLFTSAPVFEKLT